MMNRNKKKKEKLTFEVMSKKISQLLFCAIKT